MRSENFAPKPIKPIKEIKEELALLINKKISVLEYNRQSRKTFCEYVGVLSGVYNNVFTIKIETKSGFQNKSFAVSDISIGIVQYTVLWN